VNHTVLPAADGTMPHESDIASTIRSPRPVGSCGVGDRSFGRPSPVSRTSTRIGPREEITSSKSLCACLTQLLASSLAISSAASTVSRG
jgi:hypothetical protein